MPGMSSSAPSGTVTVGPRRGKPQRLAHGGDRRCGGVDERARADADEDRGCSGDRRDAEEHAPVDGCRPRRPSRGRSAALPGAGIACGRSPASTDRRPSNRAVRGSLSTPPPSAAAARRGTRGGGSRRSCPRSAGALRAGWRRRGSRSPPPRAHRRSRARRRPAVASELQRCPRSPTRPAPPRPSPASRAILSYSPKVAIANSLNGCGTMSITNDADREDRAALARDEQGDDLGGGEEDRRAHDARQRRPVPRIRAPCDRVLFAIAGLRIRGVAPTSLVVRRAAAFRMVGTTSHQSWAIAGLTGGRTASVGAMAVTIRVTTPDDARAIATVRIESWRRRTRA